MSCHSIITGVDNPLILSRKCSDLSLTPCLSRAKGITFSVCPLLRSAHFPCLFESRTASFDEWSLHVALPMGMTPLCTILIWYKKNEKLTGRKGWEGYIFRALVPLSPDLPEPFKHCKTRNNVRNMLDYNRMYPIRQLVSLIHDSTGFKWATRKNTLFTRIC